MNLQQIALNNYEYDYSDSTRKSLFSLYTLKFTTIQDAEDEREYINKQMDILEKKLLEVGQMTNPWIDVDQEKVKIQEKIIQLEQSGLILSDVLIYLARKSLGLPTYID